MPDLLESMRHAATTVHCYRQECYWLDIGRHDDYATANEIFDARRGGIPGRAREQVETQDRARPVSGLDNIWIHLLLAVLCRLPGRRDPVRLPGLSTGSRGSISARSARATSARPTSAGLLGFRYFFLVFVLDMLKGFVPVLAISPALKALGMSPPTDLPLLVALAAILGHNFPVYLRFKGGKGVATSLGALLALEPLSCAAAAVGFFVVFFLTRYVSLSSIAGALGFVAGHFLRINDPWNRSHIALSILSLTIAVLIIFRHHKNIGRIFQGTEPKVPLRRSRKQDKEG